MSAEMYNPEFVKELLEANKRPPERTFDNVEDLLRWLDERDDRG